MRYYDVKLEKKYITIVDYRWNQVRKKLEERKLWKYKLDIWIEDTFRNRKYINIKVWKLRKEISEVEIEECMNLDIDI